MYLLAFLLGIIAGLRSMTAPAAVSWAARLGRLHLDGSGFAMFGYPVVSYIWTLLAVGEIINDKLPWTPSRKALLPFVGRIFTGGLSGAALGVPSQSELACSLAGALGAVAGTLGGYELRARLVKAIGGKDLPIALLEDVIAVGGAAWIVSQIH